MELKDWGMLVWKVLILIVVPPYLIYLSRNLLIAMCQATGLFGFLLFFVFTLVLLWKNITQEYIDLWDRLCEAFEEIKDLFFEIWDSICDIYELIKDFLNI